MTICKKASLKKLPILSLFTLLMIPILISRSEAVGVGIYSGVLFSAKCLIPTLFPFFILSDMILAFGLPFDRFIRSSGLYAMIVGLICGFPHGARIATRLFEEGKIDLNEYERLLVLSNTPSPAFVIAGVGVGMLRDISYGIILYLSLLLSVIILSLFKRRGTQKPKTTLAESWEFVLTDSIKNAGMLSITIASYVIFFYGLHSLISFYVPSGAPSFILSMLLEIGSGSMLIAKDVSLHITKKMLLLGFTIGFSSLSVFMQCSSFVSKKVSRKKMLFLKLIQGILCAICAFLLTYICNISHISS